MENLNDNLPALEMTKYNCATERSKFIYLRDHYIKETIKTKNISIKHTPLTNTSVELVRETTGADTLQNAFTNGRCGGNTEHKNILSDKKRENTFYIIGRGKGKKKANLKEKMGWM